jgi:hypothetical protein
MIRSRRDEGRWRLDPADSPAAAASVDLDANYLRVIALAEARPENAPGVNKSWVSAMDEAFRRHYRAARPG